ncbi:MAG: hypothetical protein ACLSB9_09710 [Hydrogeniiclostridium mannosilyticum]
MGRPTTHLSFPSSKNTEEIIEQLQPHIRDISYRTYFRKRKEAIEALSSVLWGYTSRDSLNLLENFFLRTKKACKRRNIGTVCD